MTNNQKNWLTWVILTLVTLGIALFFGVQYPMPEQPQDPIEPIELAANFSNPVDIEGSSSAAAPALTFEGDTDTGIFRSAADTLNISTGGTERLELDSSGNLIITGDVTANGTQLTGGSSSSTFTDTTIGGTLTVTRTSDFQDDIADSVGDLTLADDIAITGSANVATWLSFSTSAWTSSDTGTLTPTTTFVNVSAGGAHTIYIGDGTDTGQLLILHQAGGPGLTIDESEYNGETGGDITFAATDIVVMIWDGSAWKLVAHSVN